MAAAFDLAVDPDVLDAAKQTSESLRGVSPERIYQELSVLFTNSDTARALRLLNSAGILREALFRSWDERDCGEAGVDPSMESRLLAIEQLGDNLSFEAGLAILFDLGLLARREDALSLSETSLRALHPSRAVLDAVIRIWHGQLALAALIENELSGEISREARTRLVRDRFWWVVLTLAKGRAIAREEDVLREVEDFARSLSHQECFPEPLLSAEDLANAGLCAGPRWGEIVAEMESLQLGGIISDREAALLWLDERADEENKGPT